MNIQIIADSCCDTTPKLRAQMGLISVPLKITIDGEKQYVDNESIDIKELLADIKATRRPVVTSAPAPEEYAWHMRNADACVVVTLSSKLSGSYNSAMAARQMVLDEYPDKKIAVFDSKSASAGELRIVLYLHKLIRGGSTFEELCRITPLFIDKVRTLFVLEDLTTLIKNGRIPKMQGMLATALMFRPIMGENGQGEIEQVERVRGTNKALDRLVQLVAERTADIAEGSLLLTLSVCNNLERAARLRKALLENCAAIGKIIMVPTSGLSTTYTNDGGVVLAYG